MFKHIFLVGIGGVSMSGIARILREMGVKVSGSDIHDSVELDKLRDMGVEVFIGHDGQNLQEDVDLVVVSAAVDQKNPEIAVAVERNIPVWRRLQLVDFLAREKVMVAVTGMHGKTTVTSMIATICLEAKEDPTIMVGGVVRAIDNNAQYGQGELWILEACEYKRSFLDLKPNIAVITNIEEEHLDAYRDLDDILETFGLFVSQVDQEGLIVAGLDDENVRRVVSQTEANVAGYGFENRPKGFNGVYWQIKNYQQKGKKYYFDLYVDDEFLVQLALSLPGKFNALNAAAAVVVADFLVIDQGMIVKSLENFLGAKRRFDVLWEKRDLVVIDDYGHHPTEISSFLQAARDKYPNRAVWVVWQPHQYSRTWQFLDDFVKSFAGVDKLLVTSIYEARDSQEIKEKIDSKKFVDFAKKKGIEAEYLATYDEAADWLKKNYQKNSLIITLGAGPVNQVAEKFIAFLAK